MGSGASTPVRATSVCCSESEASIDDHNKNHQTSKSKHRKDPAEVTLTKVTKISQNENLVKSQHDRHETEKKIVEYERKIEKLEKEVGELECNNLDLQDQVHQLSSLHNPALPSVREEEEEASGDRDCSQTIQAKDHIITTLEEEISNYKKEMRKLRIRHKKKVQTLTQRWSEEKQECSLEIMELRRKITALSEKTTVETDDYTASLAAPGDSVGGDSRANLILDLSTRISELESELLSTQSALRRKDNNHNLTSRPNSRGSQNMVDIDSVDEARLGTQPVCTGVPTNNGTVANSNNRTRDSPWSDLDLSDTETQLDLLGSNSRQDQYDLPEYEADQGSKHFGLDPASLRKISAPKDRRRRKRDSTILVSNKMSDEPQEQRFADNDTFMETIDSWHITHDASSQNGSLALIST